MEKTVWASTFGAEFSSHKNADQAAYMAAHAVERFRFLKSTPDWTGPQGATWSRSVINTMREIAETDQREVNEANGPLQQS